MNEGNGEANSAIQLRSCGTEAKFSGIDLAGVGTV